MQRDIELTTSDKFISCKKAAQVLGISVGTLYVYISTGKLTPIRRSGMRPVFSRSYLESVLKNGYEPKKPNVTSHEERNHLNEEE